MNLRPLNDTVIIEPDAEMMAVDNDPTVLKALKSNIILLPDKNMVMKISNLAVIVSGGPLCNLKPGARIVYNQFEDTPRWEGKNRIIKTHYIKGVFVGKKLKPLADNVLVEIEAEKEKTAGGIYLPDQAKEDKTEGTILAIGKVQYVAVGDRVLFGKYAGEEILIDGKKHKILKESELLAVRE